MRLKQIIIYGIVLVLFSVGIFVMINHTGSKKIPDLFPRSGDSNISAEYKNAQRSVDFYRSEIQKNPDEPKNYIQLAQVFLQEARVTGKHHEYLQKINSLLETALNLDPENLDANLTKAAVQLNLHQFEKAEKIGEWAVKKYPYSSAAYGILVDAYAELGKYDKAVEMCDKMLSIKPDLRSYSRASYLREIHGDMNGAIDAMRMAADAGVTGQENRAWALYNLANLYLHTGKTDTAEFIFKGILEERPGYAFAISGLAKVNIIKGKYEKAVEHYKNAMQNLDEHSFAEQLSDLYFVMNKKSEEKKLNELVFSEFKEHEEEGWNVDGEYAAFCLNHNLNLEEALTRAERNYNRRPGNIHAIDTYAWALYKNGKMKKASDIIEKALEINSADAVALYHLGIINLAEGNKEKAVQNLEASLNENLASHIICYEDAKEKLLYLKSLASLN